MKRIWGVSSLVVLSACISQPPPVELPQFSEYEAERRAEMIERATTILDVAKDEDAWDLGILSQDAASAGREDVHKQIHRPHFQPDRLVCEPGEPRPALDQIVELADTHSLIIINEHHAEPSHRLFIGDLAARLREKGFTHYAAEAFRPEIVNGEGYPRAGEGYYASEPMFARSIHRLRTLGYELVAYEARPDQVDYFSDDVKKQMNDREEAQANNLIDAVLGQNPDAKLIVHVGHGHVAEFPPPVPDAMPWMAARLKAKTGIDPLTISLTYCRSETGVPVLSTQAVNHDGKQIEKYTDYLIGLPPKMMQRNRPAYRVELGDRFVEVPAKLRPTDGPILIEARPPGAALEHAPIERLVLSPGEDIPLLLPPGRWSLVSVDADGVVIGAAEIEVSAG